MEVAVPRYGEYALGSRIPSGPRMIKSPSSQTRSRDFASRIVIRQSTDTPPPPLETCAPNDDTGVCEKPVSSRSMTLPIVLGTVIPIVLIVSVLAYLHRRHMKSLKREDATDPHKSMDFGMGLPSSSTGKGNKMHRANKGSGINLRHRQMSMDLDLSTPYLLPPALQGSADSLHSLARTLNQNEDPYRPIAHYAASDANSLRSLRRKEEGSSMHSGSSKDYEAGYHYKPPASSGRHVVSPRQNSMPTSPRVPEPLHTKPAPPLSDASTIVSTSPPGQEIFLAKPELNSSRSNPAPYPSDYSAMPAMPAIREPPAAAARRPINASPTEHDNPTRARGFDFDDQAQAADNPWFGSQQHSLNNETLAFSPVDDYSGPAPLSHQPTSHQVTRSAAESSPAFTQVRPVQQQGTETSSMNHNVDLYEYHDQRGMEQGHYSSPDFDEYEDRGRNIDRQSVVYQPPTSEHWLGVPQQDSRRLSVGVRPLPPQELIQSEDPAIRATRIRSFYKEYFEETKGQMLPAEQYYDEHHEYHAQEGGHRDHYDDGNYADFDYPHETAYYDPQSHAFVTPYAEPVARRAMTPPPSGSRFQGGQRGHHASFGSMSGPREGFGPPRPGTSASSARPGSAASNPRGRPRAGSAMSGAPAGQPRKRMPPPAALTTLPTPSKLRDDSVALLGAIDFAPPETFKDQAAGRSQSPLGERRPYQLKVPVHSPLANAFEELSGLPSPHLLRKSSTFTGLDFAPPRKFADADTRSETGSIRSNRSGISTAQLGAIRGGAGRVSRLPGDTIFSQAQMPQKLKPAWNMRD